MSHILERGIGTLWAADTFFGDGIPAVNYETLSRYVRRSG